jgi:hypothetical protein
VASASVALQKNKLSSAIKRKVFFIKKKKTENQLCVEVIFQQ